MEIEALFRSGLRMRVLMHPSIPPKIPAEIYEQRGERKERKIKEEKWKEIQETTKLKKRGEIKKKKKKAGPLFRDKPMDSENETRSRIAAYKHLSRTI